MVVFISCTWHPQLLVAKLLKVSLSHLWINYNNSVLVLSHYNIQGRGCTFRPSIIKFYCKSFIGEFVAIKFLFHKSVVSESSWGFCWFKNVKWSPVSVFNFYGQAKGIYELIRQPMKDLVMMRWSYGGLAGFDTDWQLFYIVVKVTLMELDYRMGDWC